jgi:arylsulfatase A-like enzyme
VKVENAPHISTDIFPTLLELCGCCPEDYELDGMSLVPILDGKGTAEHEYLFWEMEGQTAVRKGKYKLVLNGQLVEGEEQRADVFLSDLESDPSEKHNLSEKMPELCNEMKEKALEWRNGIETVWKDKFEKNYKSLT